MAYFINIDKFQIRLACPWCNDGIGQWEGVDPSFGFYSDILGQAIRPEAGFSTDLASVPRAPLLFAMMGGRYAMPAYIHDYITRHRKFKREKCDRVFLEAMRCQNAMELQDMRDEGKTEDEIRDRSQRIEGRASAMYAAVALFTASGIWMGPWDKPGYQPYPEDGL